jgi:hypothetical protein
VVAAERRPAGFVRTTGDKRALLVFDTTPGLQWIANPPVNLGLEAPTPQLRAFQATWGGLSLASVTNPPALNCGSSCLSAISGPIDPSPPGGGGGGSGVTLKPSVFGSLGGGGGTTGIGIVIARVVGTRRLFARRIPRVRRVGRVPLGPARRRNLFRWNGRVNGRRLAPGTYLLTFRALSRRGRIVAVSRSIRFRLTAARRVTGVRALP